MTPTLRDLGIDALSVEQRLDIADMLWDSVEVELEAEALTPAQRAELERRIALSDADPSRGIPWETVRAEARARWRR